MLGFGESEPEEDGGRRRSSVCLGFEDDGFRDRRRSSVCLGFGDDDPEVAARLAAMRRDVLEAQGGPAPDVPTSPTLSHHTLARCAPPRRPPNASQRSHAARPRRAGVRPPTRKISAARLG